MSIIRKISVGQDFPNRVMHYQIGKSFEVFGEECTVVNIVLEKTTEGRLGYNIYVKGSETTFLWKSIIGMPVHIEYDITFS